MEAVGLVRHDAPGVFQAIEKLNPYAAGVRQRFFALAAQLEKGAALGKVTRSGWRSTLGVPGAIGTNDLNPRDRDRLDPYA
jgi:hypothetical protein